MPLPLCERIALTADETGVRTLALAVRSTSSSRYGHRTEEQEAFGDLVSSFDDLTHSLNALNALCTRYAQQNQTKYYSSPSPDYQTQLAPYTTQASTLLDTIAGHLVSRLPICAHHRERDRDHYFLNDVYSSFNLDAWTDQLKQARIAIESAAQMVDRVASNSSSSTQYSSYSAYPSSTPITSYTSSSSRTSKEDRVIPVSSTSYTQTAYSQTPYAPHEDEGYAEPMTRGSTREPTSDYTYTQPLMRGGGASGREYDSGYGGSSGGVSYGDPSNSQSLSRGYSNSSAYAEPSSSQRSRGYSNTSSYPEPSSSQRSRGYSNTSSYTNPTSSQPRSRGYSSSNSVISVSSNAATYGSTNGSYTTSTASYAPSSASSGYEYSYPYSTTSSTAPKYESSYGSDRKSSSYVTEVEVEPERRSRRRDDRRSTRGYGY